MKKLLVLLLTVFALNSCEKDPEIIGVDAEKKLPKVDVCHYDEYTDTWKTISVSENALKAHLKHGDYEGDCCEGKTYVPDDQFETALIYWGYDDVMDDYVKTCNIQDVTSLRFERFYDMDTAPYWNVKDFTGIEGFSSLTQLQIWYMHGPKLDLSKNIALESLYFREPYMIKDLDLSKNKNLKNLVFLYRCSVENLILPQDVDNKLGGIGLSNNAGHLKKLDLSMQNSLVSFYGDCGPLEEDVIFPSGENNVLSSLHGSFWYSFGPGHIDLSNLKNLTSVELGLNSETVNINNGNNEALLFLLLNSSSITCVQVDDVDYAKGADNWHVPSPDVYSTDCGN